LSDGAARFAARYPRVWHVMEADGAGPWLAETGLRPAAEFRLGGANRDGFVRIAFGDGRVAVLRPQQMPDRRLLPTLAGTFAGQPERWRRHVDQHVFFWAEPRRRDAFARACARLSEADGPAPVALAFDTAALLYQHGAAAFFATINTGSTVRGGARVRRDETTLRPVAEYRSGAVAELAIRGRIELRSDSLAMGGLDLNVRRQATIKSNSPLSHKLTRRFFDTVISSSLRPLLPPTNRNLLSKRPDLKCFAAIERISSLAKSNISHS
jgi:hypothetical protein